MAAGNMQQADEHYVWATQSENCLSRFGAGVCERCCALALEHVLTVVREAGGEPVHVGRMTIFVTNLKSYKASVAGLGQAYQLRMGRHYPAMALVEVSGLVDDKAVVEIEATAVIPSS